MLVLDQPADVAGANLNTLEELRKHLARLHNLGTALRTFALTGSRTWFDWRTVWSVLATLPRDAEMFNGMAAGADTLGWAFWRSQGSLVRPFEPNWTDLGKRAGNVRNELMMEHMPGLVVAFLHHSSISSGTRGAIRHASNRQILTFVFHQAA